MKDRSIPQVASSVMIDGRTWSLVIAGTTVMMSTDIRRLADTARHLKLSGIQGVDIVPARSDRR